MPSIDFEGRPLPLQQGDTIASVLQREGVPVVSRSFKYHRPRGLYCGTGDCPNCMVTVDGEPAVRSCITPASDGQKVSRSNGWPSVEHDALAAIWYFRWALPVGFYYKVFTKPRGLWSFVEKFIIRVAGLGPIDTALTPEALERRNLHPDLVVIGGGVAGLSAALGAAEHGDSVVLIDEGLIGEKVAPGPTRTAIDSLLAEVRAQKRITVIERAPVTGIYEGPLVTAASRHVLHLVHPKRIVVATGAVERHAVFPGSDLPGVWLSRGAARMAGVHQVKPGASAVVVLGTEESLVHLDTLRKAGVAIRLAVIPSALASRLPRDVPSMVDGEVVEAEGPAPCFRRGCADSVGGPRGLTLRYRSAVARFLASPWPASAGSAVHRQWRGRSGDPGVLIGRGRRQRPRGRAATGRGARTADGVAPAARPEDGDRLSLRGRGRQ